MSDPVESPCVRCEYLRVKDWHYSYCTAQPSNGFDPDLGHYFVGRVIPNEGCPKYGTKDSDE